MVSRFTAFTSEPDDSPSTSASEPSSERAERIDEYAKAVAGVVGEAHAQSLGAVLHHLCCTVMDAVGKLPPTPRRLRPLRRGAASSSSS